MFTELSASKERNVQLETENSVLKEIEKEYIQLQNTVKSYEETIQMLKQKEKESVEQIQNQTEAIQSLSVKLVYSIDL